jgi:hypothetical protein
MAKKPGSSQEYVNDAMYDVKLRSVVRIGGIKLLPLDQHHIKGSVLNRIVAESPDAIGSVTKRG